MGNTPQRVPLTDLSLRKLVVAAGERCEIWDSKIPGFGVRASGQGTKSFVLLYRFGGQSRRCTLGRYPALSLAEARALALDFLNKAERGIDPGAEAKTVSGGPSFAAVVDQFVALHCGQRNRESTRKETERILRSVFIASWGKKRLVEITRGDVLDIMDSRIKSGRPSAANHALAAIRKFFNWCVERGYIDKSPCVGLGLPAKPQSRDRVLNERELCAVWIGAGELGYPFGTMVQLLILTAQRRGEVVGMEWHHLDLASSTWSMPGGTTKNGDPHVVPLSQGVADIIGDVPRLHERLVFPARGNCNATISGFSKSKRRLDEVSGVSDWTLHDLRRSAATHMARLGVAPHIIERILNHVTGTLGGVAGVYNRFHYLPEMRAALELWAAHFDKLTSPEHVAPQATAQPHETS